MNTSCNTVTIEDALKEISMLNSSKAIQVTDIPLKVIKDNSDFLRNKYALFSTNLSVKENFQII